MSNLYFDEGPPSHSQKVCIATTAYDSPDASYTYSIARSRTVLSEAGIQSAYMLLQGYCHVDDSRNAVVRNFLASDCTDLVFIDADVTWEPQGLLQLCKRDCDLVGGVYPYRRASDNMPVRLMAHRKPSDDGLLEVEGLPAGFMRIKRHVLETLAVGSVKYFDKTEETPQIFERITDPDKTRWGGDIAFCNKWRAYGKVFADTEIRLGHVAKVIFRDSLAANIRRLSGTTLSHIIPKIRSGTENPTTDYDELFQSENNVYAADPEVLALCVGIARKCRGPIIETGSGLSSVIMAAANPGQRVYSLEHADFYAERTRLLAMEADATNLTVNCAPLVDFWYDLSKFDLPNKFAFGFCDGPPRMLGTRMKFFDEIAPRCSVIAIDDVGTDIRYAAKVSQWANENNRSMRLLGRAALLMRT